MTADGQAYTPHTPAGSAAISLLDHADRREDPGHSSHLPGVTDAAVFTGRAAVRAGILVTGTEVLTGIINDRNGPWLSEQLRDIGVDAAMIEIVGDRPADLRTALEQMTAAGVAVIITSGGLGPTADDLTAEVVGAFCGREMVLDAGLEERIAEIIRRALQRWPEADREALREANRKQAVIPSGATVLAPRGTAPGLVVPPAEGRSGPVVVVLPGPPGRTAARCGPMRWGHRCSGRQAIAGATVYRREIVRLFGMPEAEIANTLRAARHGRAEARAARDHHLPAPRGDRGLHPL